MSTLKATNLQNASSSSTNLALDTSGNATSAGTVVMSSPYTMRNKIINGAMVIDQRNAGASVNATNSQPYTLDRWNAYNSNASSKFTVQQNAGSITPPAGFTNYIGCTSSSAYVVTATDRFWLQQVIEGYNISDLGWGTSNAKTVTLSFWVYSSLTGTFGGALSNYTSNPSYPFSYSIPVANTWTQVSVTITGPTSGSWNAGTNSGGIQLYFSLGAGSTYSGTAGAWSANNYVSVTGATSVVGTNGATFYITGVQLERGTVATPFEYRNYQQELAMCRRYYKPKTGTYSTQFLGAGTSGYNQGYTISLNTTMRVAPTVTVYDGVPTAGKIYFNGNGVTGNVDFITTDQFRIYATTPSTGAITFAFDWEASAEL